VSHHVGVGTTTPGVGVSSPDHWMIAAVCSTDTPVSTIPVVTILTHEAAAPVLLSMIPVSIKVLVGVISDLTLVASKIGVIIIAPLRTNQYIQAIPSANTNRYLNLSFIVVMVVSDKIQ
jgi:hypothetical protein